MPYLSTRADAWLLHRLDCPSVVTLLPSDRATGESRIFNGRRPASGGPVALFLEFHQAGAVVVNCLGTGKHGLTAQYVTAAWQPGDDLTALEALLDAVEARFLGPSGNYLDEVYGGYRYSVLAQDAEPQQVGVSQGVLYSSAGYRWLVGVESA